MKVEKGKLYVSDYYPNGAVLMLAPTRAIYYDEGPFWIICNFAGEDSKLYVQTLPKGTIFPLQGRMVYTPIRETETMS